MPYSITEFEHIYKRTVSRSMSLAITLLNDADDARDVVQDVFLRLWESGITISNPEAFVLRSVRNACLDRIRSLSIHERIRRSLPPEPIVSDNDTEQREADVRHAVDTLLTVRERQVIDRVYSAGMSYKEAATSLNVSVAMINKSLVSAMKTLRNHFNTHKK